MKYVKILLTYLAASIIPPLILFLTGLWSADEDCGQCAALIFVASLILFGKHALVQLLQFLGWIQVKNKFIDVLLRICYAFFYPVVYDMPIIIERIQFGKWHTDFELLKWGILADFVLSFVTLYVLLSIRTNSDANETLH